MTTLQEIEAAAAALAEAAAPGGAAI